MKENKYDDPVFFEKYSHMARSERGLAGAGEWPTLKDMLPDLRGKRVLDLGCGYGWHCEYAVQQGAARVVGVDLSEQMLARARARCAGLPVTLERCAIEEISFPASSFDLVFSSLAFHYVADFADVVRRVRDCLVPGGDFVFSCEHPVFTAYGSQDWYYDDQGNILHFPVDRYFLEGPREAIFLGEPVRKYHRTLTTYCQTLLGAGFTLTGLREPQPPAELMDLPGMADELRRPMMLLVSARLETRQEEKL